jgi:hypothetical protein
MVKHRSDTRWPDNREVEWRCVRSAPCTRRRWACAFWLSLKTKVDGLSGVYPQNRWVGFPGLGLKTSSYCLVIWTSKLPWRFLSLGIKTKQATVYRLCHKINGKMKMAQSTRRDLAACFIVKVRRGWYMWQHHRGCIELKLKTDGSIRRAVLDLSTLTLSFSVY